MIYFPVLIIFIIILIAVSRLSSQVKRLEQELSALKKKLEASPVQEIPEEPSLAEEATVIFQHSPEPASEPGPEPFTEQPAVQASAGWKDWINPASAFIKQNILTLIGIFTLVLGIGYFVKYAVDRDWIGESSRTGIGFLTGAALITAGRLLRKNYRIFAHIIMGGGISVLYFTTTLAFREYQIFSQDTAFAITCLITLVSLLLSYKEDSEALMAVALIGGFTAPLMISTGQSNYPFLFTYLMILNTGMLVVSYLKMRKTTGWLAFIITVAYFFFWTMEKAEMMTVPFFLISYVLFYCFALKDYFRTGILSPSSVLLLVLINFTTLTGTVFIFNTLQYSPAVLFPAGFALANSFFLYREFTRRNSGTSFSAFAGITVSLLTVALALQFKTHLITTSWAVEATLLLFIWKKTRLAVFKTLFKVLYLFVIVAQIITWSGYSNDTGLSVIFNPVFLTSLVTVITTITDILILRSNRNPAEKNKSGLPEDIFTGIGYGMVYLTFLLETGYHISSNPVTVIFSICLLFTLYYIFAILAFSKKLQINPAVGTLLGYVFFILMIINVSIAGSGLVSEILSGTAGTGLYVLYLAYCLPFACTVMKILPETDFFRLRMSYWLLSAAFTAAISFELCHLYVLVNAPSAAAQDLLIRHFSLLHLPILWAVLSSLLIYKGLKSQVPEYGKAGFALLGLTIGKLYLYDVWRMDHISRITAFIILGLILLCSSFLFQYLKKAIRHIIDKKEQNPDDKDPEL